MASAVRCLCLLMLAYAIVACLICCRRFSCWCLWGACVSGQCFVLPYLQGRSACAGHLLGLYRCVLVRAVALLVPLLVLCVFCFVGVGVFPLVLPHRRRLLSASCSYLQGRCVCCIAFCPVCVAGCCSLLCCLPCGGRCLCCFVASCACWFVRFSCVLCSVARA